MALQKKHLVSALAIVVAASCAMLLPVGAVRVGAETVTPARKLDLSAFPPTPPTAPVPLLFIHHSCGGQLLAERGDEVGDDCVYTSHPNGGDLRSALASANYQVHEASYGSIIGDRTDMFDHLPKFRTQMDRILRTELQDQRLPNNAQNRIVIWKSCFTESEFVGAGTPPGNENGPELTLENAKATMRAILPELAKHPAVLFVYVTAPPLSPNLPSTPLGKWIVKTLLGRQVTEARHRERGQIARQLNNWMVSPDGWLAGYAHTNVVVFDYFDVLTANGRSNFLAYLGPDIYDSHPAAEGNVLAARAFVPFLNRAYARLTSAE